MQVPSTLASDAQPGNELVDLLKSEFNMSEPQIAKIFVLLTPMLEQYIQKILLQTFSDEEVEALEKAAQEEYLSEEQKAAMYKLGFENKTGQTINNKIIEFTDQVATVIIQSKSITDNVMNRIKDLPDDKKEEESLNLLNSSINQILN